MALIVQKFGGTSVGSVERIANVAKRVAKWKAAGHDVVVVPSAMAGETNRLIALAKQVQEHPDTRELDVVASTGEQVSIGLLAIALQSLGLKARSYTGFQVKILTDDAHTKARILSIEDVNIRRDLDEGHVVVVAGFQGIDERGNITTLGRGGSDTTAVAVAAAMNADVCEIYTDVDGVFTADPRIVPKARRLANVSYAEMLELAACGSKVLHLRCVEYARRYGIPIHVRSSFSAKPGTWVADPDVLETIDKGDRAMEQPSISGVAHDRSEAKITVVAVPDKVGEAARIFTTLGIPTSRMKTSVTESVV